MRHLLSLALLFVCTNAEARWEVKSEFQLHLTETTFDKVIQDFWQSLQGAQHIALGNVTVPVDSNTTVQVNGLNVDLNYSFPLPVRVDPTHREWELKSDQIGAQISVAELVVTQNQVIDWNGISIGTTVTAVCNNIVLSLPTGSASIMARVRAEVAQNQVQLSMPAYAATWPQGAWDVKSLNCPALANIQGLIKQQIVNYLSNYQNLDSTVSGALASEFAEWSKNASLLLLSQQQLPQMADYVNMFYEPKTAVENNGNGLILGGTIRFEYPFVARGQNIVQEYSLPAGTQLVPQANPQIIIPFAAVRAMMMGIYFAGKLEYSLRSTELPAFTDLMNSRFKQFFGWPDLMSFDTDTTFLFQVAPMGPPSFEGEKGDGKGTISGNMTLPLSAKMYAPINGKYTPYVEFKSTLSGPASLSLQNSGKVKLSIAASKQPTTYAFATTYLTHYNSRANTHIAIDTIASAVRTSLNSDGMELTIPPLKVGKQLTLSPAGWNLQSNKVLRLDFSAGSAATAKATAAH